MILYDPNAIYKLATRLYIRAHALVLVHTTMGIIIGGILGKAYSACASAMTTLNTMAASASSTLFSALGVRQTYVQPSPPMTDWTLVGVLVVGLLGFWIGWNKAFFLKLQAQVALCQARIEENTRHQT
jgi:hypothetical protein